MPMMKLRYGDHQIDWLGICGLMLVVGATAALLILMSYPF